MAKGNSSGQPQTKAWRRILLPLYGWVILVLLLFALRSHERLSARTNLRFTAAVAGQPRFSEVSAQLDGQSFSSGERVRIGWHQLVLAHPKGRSFATNLFVWYGERNLGALTLARTAGTLDISTTPPAQSVTVRGPELRTDLTSVSAEKLAAPADEYSVTAIYPYFTVEQRVTVADNQTAICVVAPAVGDLHANFGYAGARYELRRLADSQPQNQVLESGELPATITALKVGAYQLRARYRGLVVDHSVTIAATPTNQLAVEFPLGNISIETKPTGAVLRDVQGNELGKTPFNLTGVPAGAWRGEVVLTNYVPVPLAVTVLAKQTVTLQTNLMRRSLATALTLMEQNRREANEDLGPLTDAFQAALKDDPENVGVVKVLKKLHASQALVDAYHLGKSGDLAGALRGADGALALMPEDQDMQQQVADFKKSIQEQQAKVAADSQIEVANKLREAAALRVSRPRDYFAKLMGETPHSTDFVDQTLTVRGQMAEVRTKVIEALGKSIALKFAIEENAQPFEEGFLIRGKMNLLDGFRRCYLVGGQTANGEVTIRFKVLEYTWPPELALAALISRPSEDRAISINQSNMGASLNEARRAEGIRLVTDRIRSAFGG